jgi:nucleoside-diphosphate-sugar epimerase
VRLLVTGGAGFLGRHVAEVARARGHQVVTLRRPHTSASPPSTGAIEHDLRAAAGLADALRGTECVVHCAASLGGDAAAQRADTVDATANLLSAMREAGVARIVGIGTFAIYDYERLPDDGVLDEQAPIVTPTADRAPYISAKLEQERIIRQAAQQHGWAWMIVRPGLVYGPGRTWFHHLGVRLSDHRWLCLAPRSLLPLVHVDDCAEAIVLAAERATASGAVLNLVGDAPPTRREYVAVLASAAPSRPQVHEIPWGPLRSSAGMAGWVNRLAGGRLPVPDLLRPASVHARIKPLRYPNDRARRALDWTPVRPWKEALLDALAGGT